MTSPTPRDQLRQFFSDARSGSSQRAIEALALLTAAGIGVLVGVAALVAFRLQSAPIAGSGSVGQFATVAAAVVAIIVFVGVQVLTAKRSPGARVGVLDVVDVAALSIAHAVIAALTVAVLADVLQRGFVDAVVFPLPTILLAAASGGVVAYLVCVSSARLDLDGLALVLALFLIEGVLAATLAASDPHWWRDNLSALGVTGETSASMFNLTMVVAGVLVTTLARYTTRSLPAPETGLRAVRTCLIFIGLCLMIVGLFPVDIFFLVHTGFATGMAVTFGVLVVGIRWWIPSLARSFLVLGWAFVAVIGWVAVLFALGSYTLTAVELVAGLLVFAWLIVFIRNAAALLADSTPVDTAAVGAPAVAAGGATQPL